MTRERDIRNQLSQVLLDLELVSHGCTMNFDPSRGGGDPLGPSGGIRHGDDKRFVKGEENHMRQKSHLFFVQRVRAANSDAELELLLRDAREALDAWQRTPQTLEPEYGSFAWKRMIAESSLSDQELAVKWHVSSKQIGNYRKKYAA